MASRFRHQSVWENFFEISEFSVRNPLTRPLRYSTAELPEGNQFLFGYEEKFVNEVDEDFLCPICKLPLRSPVVTSCGHRFCKGCIDKLHKREIENTQDRLLRSNIVSLQVTCPVDRTKLSRDKDMFPDKFTERKILSLPIKCPNEDCKWTGELIEKEKHRACCPLEVVKCTSKNCTEKMARKNLEEHVTTTCQWRMVSCTHCHTSHLVCRQSEHQKECRRFPVNCPMNCGKVMPREETTKHRACCPLEVVKCTSKNCAEKMARKNLEEHVKTTCQWRMLRCENCHITHPACHQQKHQKECRRFPVNCPMNCGKVMPREETTGHENHCPEKVVECTSDGCSERMARKNIKGHVATTCQWRLLRCEHCDMQHPACHQSDHQLVCKRFPLNCPNECGKAFPREEMEAHTGTDCPLTIVSCPFADMDCPTKARREALDLHIKDFTSVHLDLARVKLTQMYEDQEKLQEKLDSTHKEHEELKEKTRKIEERFQEKLDNTRKEHDELKERTRKIEEKLNYTVHLLSTVMKT